MSDNEKKGTSHFAQDGYTVAPQKMSINQGYKPASGQLGAKPTTGSVVSKPSSPNNTKK